MSAKGLYHKYVVSKRDGSPVDPKADYFVLRLDTDRAARRSAEFYAAYVSEDNPQIARDLRERCERYEEEGNTKK
jgi:hypothetical protein